MSPAPRTAQESSRRRWRVKTLRRALTHEFIQESAQRLPPAQSMLPTRQRQQPSRGCVRTPPLLLRCGHSFSKIRAVFSFISACSRRPCGRLGSLFKHGFLGDHGHRPNKRRAKSNSSRITTAPTRQMIDVRRIICLLSCFVALTESPPWLAVPNQLRLVATVLPPIGGLVVVMC